MHSTRSLQNPPRPVLFIGLAGCLVLAWGPFTPSLAGAPQGTPATPAQQAAGGEGAAGEAELSSWGVAPGFSLEVDSRGFHLPTALAVIPNPGEGPDAPLYFVAELRGGIKVVTRDRRVHPFAEVPTWGRQDEGLAGSSQQGLAGLCLAPERGYLFATFTDPGAEGVMRNRIVRFSSTPHHFGLEPDDARPVGEILSDFQSAPAHQIGNCAVRGDELFVGVGDGGNPAAAGMKDVLLGKVVCMRLDGSPCGDPPFGATGPEAYVWAHGFRNPFGLAWVDDVLYAAENGIAVDRFLRVERGADHLWRGSDQNIASRADLVFFPAVAPVQLAWVPAESGFLPPGWPGHFVAAGHGGRQVPGGAVAFSGPDSGTSARDPLFLLENLDHPRSQPVTGVALGPDGIYVAPTLPVGESGAVLRLRYDPPRAHFNQLAGSNSLAREARLEATARHGCTGCHTIAGEGGGIGPTLDRFAFDFRLSERLNSEAYRLQLHALDTLDAEPFRSFRQARADVLAATGDERVWVWFRHFLLEPRFDNPDNQMQNPGLSPAEAEAVRAELFDLLGRTPAPTVGLPRRIARFARANWKAISVGGVGGGGGVLVLGLLGLWLVSRRRASRVDESTADQTRAA